MNMLLEVVQATCRHWIDGSMSYVIAGLLNDMLTVLRSILRFERMCDDQIDGIVHVPVVVPLSQ